MPSWNISGRSSRASPLNQKGFNHPNLPDDDRTGGSWKILRLLYKPSLFWAGAWDCLALSICLEHRCCCSTYGCLKISCSKSRSSAFYVSLLLNQQVGLSPEKPERSQIRLSPSRLCVWELQTKHSTGHVTQFSHAKTDHSFILLEG